MADVPEQVLRKVLHSVALQHKYDDYKLDVRCTNSGGANYTSQLFCITITAPNKKKLQLFGKVAVVGEAFRAQIPVRFFYTERFFYTDVVTAYSRLLDEHKVPLEHRPVFPKLYGYNDKEYEETLVLENLAAQGYTDHNRLESISWEYGVGVVTELAKFHALSIAYRYHHPEDYKRLTKDMKSGFHKNEFMEHMWRAGFASILEVMSAENQQRLRKLYGEGGTDMFRKAFVPLRLPVMTHSDFRTSNLMHKIRDDGSVEILAIDYQSVQEGCPVMDLINIIFTGTDEEFRRKHYTQLIDLYYMQLCQALKRLHVDPEKVYPRKDYDYELKELTPYGLALAIFVLPLLTVTDTEAPEVDGELQVADLAPKPSDICAERLAGVINDYVRWGLM